MRRCNWAARFTVQMAMSPLNQVVQVPVPPTPPALPRLTVVQDGRNTVINLPARPMTAREVQALKVRRSELSSQLTSASSRRNELSRALRTADGVNRTGLEQRIELLDKRILQIETDIAENGRLLASAPASLANTSSSTRPPTPLGLNSGQITGIAIVGTIFVLFPLAIAIARSIWKRGARAPVAPPITAESSQRMERLEQAVDAIALEIERISEGQRFVTRLLTEGSAPMLAVGQQAVEPVRLPDRDALRASRDTA